MPKSKRNKQVDLSKAKKHGQEGKKKLFEEVRSCVESYAHVFIFSVNDMRNSKIKSVREQWRHSRFFIGKNKVMALALGFTPASEFRQNLHKIGERLKGECGLLFSNQSVEEVLKWFNSYAEEDFARSGNRATETVNLKEGPLSQFPHNLEPYLRQLGLPTTLKKGVVNLIQDHTVCKVGDVLTPETAKIVKLLGYKMAEFFIKIDCVWSQDGSFVDLSSGGEYKENISTLNVSALSEKENAISYDNQAMEVDKSIHLEKDVLEKTESKNIENGWLVEEDDPTVEDINKVTFENTSDEDSDDESIPDLVEEKNQKENDDVMEVAEKKVIVDEKDLFENKSENANIFEESSGVSSEFIKKVKPTSLDVVEDDKTYDIKNSIEEVALKKDAISQNLKDSSVDIVENKESEIPSVIPELSSAISSSVDSNIMKSPLVLEKRPKFSPRVTRSVKKAKKPNPKLAECENKSEDNVKNEIQIDEVSEHDIERKKRAHKRRSTGESPIERKLRNRSIKIVKNKK